MAYEEAAYGEDPYQRIALVLPKRPSGKVLLFLRAVTSPARAYPYVSYTTPALTARIGG